MKKRLVCVLATAALLLGILTGCGGGPANGSDSGKMGVGSSKPDKGDHTNDDPVAVMNERVKAVNDAANFECIGLEETVEAGLLFYSLSSRSSGKEPHDYHPDKPLNYSVGYAMVKEHMEGIVSEDTYMPLLKNAVEGEVVSSDVIETDDLYIYYHTMRLPDDPKVVGPGCYGRCFILVKGTDILYRFSADEGWRKADYYERHLSYDPDLFYRSDDAEYIFTAEFWNAFAQTVKFVGNTDDDFENDKYFSTSISTAKNRTGYIPINSYDESRYIFLDIDEDENMVEVKVKIPYIEEWYAGEHMSESAICESFGEFLQNRGEEYGFLVIDDFGQGEPTMFFNNGLYKYTGGGGVTLIHDFADIEKNWYFTSIYTDADRTHLMFSGGAPHSEELKIVDLTTFEVTDEVYVIYDADADGIFEFSSAEVNGASVDEGTGWAARNEWYSLCNIALGDMVVEVELDLDAAWSEYENRK